MLGKDCFELLKSYKELNVWRLSIDLTLKLYRVTQAFPDIEKFGLVSQIRRAAVSIPANIAEGWGRGRTKEYINFLRIARGSLRELETHLIISGELSFIKMETLNEIMSMIEGVGRMLNRLINNLEKRNDEPSKAG